MSIDAPMITGFFVLTLLISTVIYWQFGEDWRGKSGAIRKPMTVTLKTEKTPADLIAAANVARNKLIVISIFWAVLAWSLLWMVNPALAVLLRDLLFNTVAAFARGLAAILGFVADSMS